MISTVIALIAVIISYLYYCFTMITSETDFADYWYFLLMGGMITIGYAVLVIKTRSIFPKER